MYTVKAPNGQHPTHACVQSLQCSSVVMRLTEPCNHNIKGELVLTCTIHNYSQVNIKTLDTYYLNTCTCNYFASLSSAFHYIWFRTAVRFVTIGSWTIIIVTFINLRGKECERQWRERMGREEEER